MMFTSLLWHHQLRLSTEFEKGSSPPICTPCSRSTSLAGRNRGSMHDQLYFLRLKARKAFSCGFVLFRRSCVHVFRGLRKREVCLLCRKRHFMCDSIFYLWFQASEAVLVWLSPSYVLRFRFTRLEFGLTSSPTCRPELDSGFLQL